jgi:hypothetical protein
MRLKAFGMAFLGLVIGLQGARLASAKQAAEPAAKAEPAAPKQTAQPTAKAEIVRSDQHAFVDDGGPFLARGASLLWALWGYEHDRARLARNLSTLREWGIDYIRVLGVVGAPGDRPACGPGVQNCDSWRDRRLDPNAPGYAQNIAALTDWAYREYGIRVQWTIFGGTDYTPTPESRRAVVERFADMSKGREHTIFAFEVANESSHTGFPGEEGRNELRALARLLKSRTPNLVALSAPDGGSCAGAQGLYRDSVADLLTLHMGRVGPENGEHWAALRQIWDSPRCQGVPLLASSNEPIGPESSVASLDDPVALAAMAFVTYGSGVGAFVLHTGPGIRGGGAADLALGRHSNLWELPTAARIASGLSTLTTVLPGDFANWTRHDIVGDAPDPPFGAADKTEYAGLYCSSKGAEFACVVAGVRKPVSLTVRRNMTVTLHDLVSGKAEGAQRLTAGAAVSLPARPAAVLIRGRLE